MNDVGRFGRNTEHKTLAVVPQQNGLLILELVKVSGSEGKRTLINRN